MRSYTQPYEDDLGGSTAGHYTVPPPASRTEPSDAQDRRARLDRSADVIVHTSPGTGWWLMVRVSVDLRPYDYRRAFLPVLWMHWLSDGTTRIDVLTTRGILTDRDFSDAELIPERALPKTIAKGDIVHVDRDCVNHPVILPFLLPADFPGYMEIHAPLVVPAGATMLA